MMNNRQGRILIVDDDPDWRKELVETLQDGGFHAEAAPTINQALQRLSNSFFHLLILDIRMDVGDGVGAQPNIDGINFLRILDERGLSRALTIVMLSAYGNTELMRRAFHGHQVLDFLDKYNFESQRFLQNIREIFATKLQINLQLRIHWEPERLAEQALRALEQGSERLKPGRSRRQGLTLELEDLLCRLFSRADSVLVQPITPGYSGTSVLWVQPAYAPTGIGRPMVIKFGAAHLIDREERNFADYVKPFIGGGRNTTIENVRYTSHLGGIVYSLLGGDSDRLQDFGAFYRQVEIEHIYEALDNLFFDTCKNWYAGRVWKLHDLAADYRPVPKERLETIAGLNERIVLLREQQRFHLKALSDERTFTNPLQAVAGRSFVRPTYVCLNHGDFNQRNLLVDRARRCWLIDFETTGHSHYLRDIATLDSVIRYQLLGEEEATLKERLEMEEALCGIRHLGELEHSLKTFSPGNPALAKAYATTLYLRKIAHRMAQHSSHDALSEYSIALFYKALETSGYSTLAIQQREHALLCASLLIDKLEANE